LCGWLTRLFEEKKHIKSEYNRGRNPSINDTQTREPDTHHGRRRGRSSCLLGPACAPRNAPPRSLRRGGGGPLLLTSLACAPHPTQTPKHTHRKKKCAVVATPRRPARSAHHVHLNQWHARTHTTRSSPPQRASPARPQPVLLSGTWRWPGGCRRGRGRRREAGRPSTCPGWTPRP